MKVCYLGPENSYSHIMARQVFDSDKYDLQANSNFYDIVQAVMTESDTIGLLPIENSTTSNVHENIDYIFSNNLQIIGEAYLSISLNLIGLKNSSLNQIKIVYSHEKALAQCSVFLNQNQLKTTSFKSTSDAVKHILAEGDLSLAAIGSSASTCDDRLQLLSQDIANESHNLTRFVMVAQENLALFNEAANKLSITFSALHQPGALAKILTAISAANGNLTYIQSKPIAGRDFHYSFWIDIESTPDNLDYLIDQIKNNSLEYSLRGRYVKGSKYLS